MSDVNLNALWDGFLDEWPIDRVRSMTLEEYTNLNRSDAFVYWLEKTTEMLGSIWGGSAFKWSTALVQDNLRPPITSEALGGAA